MAQIKCVFNSVNGDNTGTYARTGKGKSFSSPGLLVKKNCPNGTFYVDDSDTGNGYYLLLNPSNYGLPNQTMYVYINKSFLASMESTKTTTNTTSNNTTTSSTSSATTTTTNQTELSATSDAETFQYSLGLDQQLTSMLSDRANESAENLLGITRVLGAPFQFLPETDCRPYSGSKMEKMGRQYADNIMLEAPIVTFVPGVPSYLADFDKTNREVIENYLSTKKFDQPISEVAMEKISSTEGRYFDFVANYADYIKYVNALCRMSAIYMGLGDKTVPGTTTTYKRYDWANWQNVNNGTDNEDTSSDGVWDTITDYASSIGNGIKDALFGDYRYVRCYVDPSVSFSESISNSTTSSMFAGLFDQLEGLSKELSFFTNGYGNAALDGLVSPISSTASAISDTSNISRLLGMAEHVVSGSNVIFPEIWGDSAYNKSFNIVVNLLSPYGDDESIYLNVIVPMMFLIALGLPRQTSANSFASPFLVKVFAKGLFSCDLGIVQEITIEKRGSGDAYNVTGLPLEVKVSLSVKDLYNNLMMPKTSQPWLFINNQGMIEYLATTCGLDILKPNISTKIESIIASFMNAFYDMPSNLVDSINQRLRNSISPLFMLGGGSQ